MHILGELDEEHKQEGSQPQLLEIESKFRLLVHLAPIPELGLRANGGLLYNGESAQLLVSWKDSMPTQMYFHAVL